MNKETSEEGPPFDLRSLGGEEKGKMGFHPLEWKGFRALGDDACDAACDGTRFVVVLFKRGPGSSFGWLFCSL